MYQLSNNRISLTISMDGAQMQINDLVRNCSWEMRAADFRYLSVGDNEPRPLINPSVSRNDEVLTVQYTLLEGNISYQWRLQEDYLAVTMTSEVQDITWISLPGRVHTVDRQQQLALPLYQGVLIRPQGEQWQHTVGHQGHFGFSMAMGAYLASGGALLVAHESPCNWQATFGEDEELYLNFNHQRCPAERDGLQLPYAFIRKHRN